MHRILGCDFAEKKHRIGRTPTILGVTHNYREMKVEIKAERKAELVEEILGILRREFLTAGEASKIKGKLQFAAAHFWGKIGRPFMRALSERQFSSTIRTELNDALRIALFEWLRIIMEVEAKELTAGSETEIEAVIYTDGYYPDARRGDHEEPRVGAVIFSRQREIPLATSIAVPQEVIDTWIPRETQIAMVETIAVNVALETFEEMIVGKRVVVMIDSESVLGAIVKGYSDREDICGLVSVVWEQIRRMNVVPFFERIPTDGNLSDGPSRLNWGIAGRCGWGIVPARIPAGL